MMLMLLQFALEQAARQIVFEIRMMISESWTAAEPVELFDQAYDKCHLNLHGA
jgi:hypothetical protein